MFELPTRKILGALSGVMLAGAALAQGVVLHESYEPGGAGLRDYCRWVGPEDGARSAVTVGLASGAHRRPIDGAGVIWTVSDLGPDFACGKRSALEVEAEASPGICEDVASRRFEPGVDCAPTLYRLGLDTRGGGFTIEDEIKLKTSAGRIVSGLRGVRAPADLGKPVDAEAVLRLSDGSFWIGEEAGPSLLHVAADGRVLERVVPEGQEFEYAGAATQITLALPAVLARGAGNSGIEALAVSPDERFLYFTTQRPLRGESGSEGGRILRIFKMTRASAMITGEYVYELDDADKARVSDMVALGPDRLLLLERGEAAKLYEVDLTGARNILGTKWDDPATTPSLENRKTFSGTGLAPIEKTLRVELATDAKIEGMTFLGDGALALITDNDFGEDGAATEIFVLRGRLEPDAAVYTRE